MTLVQSLQTARCAARTNFVPGLILQGFLLAFLGAYLFHAPTREALERVATFRSEAGGLFTFFIYSFVSALLPEILKVIVFQRGRITPRNQSDLFTGIPLWGCWGLIVDAFYRLQTWWFGTGTDAGTLLVKVAVDQLLFGTLVGTPLLTAIFGWRDAGFRPAALRSIFSWRFVFERCFPLQIAGWIVWIPAVTLIYFMPAALQIPVAALIQCFWVLIFTFISRGAR